MIISCDTSQQNELRVRLSTSTTSSSSSPSPTSSRSNSRSRFISVETDSLSSDSSSSSHDHDNDVYDDDSASTIECKGHYYQNQASSTLSHFIRSIHIILICALAKSKMRYILGLYTFMITIILHFSSSSINNIQSIVENGSGNNNAGLSISSIQQQQPSV